MKSPDNEKNCFIDPKFWYVQYPVANLHVTLKMSKGNFKELPFVPFVPFHFGVHVLLKDIF